MAKNKKQTKTTSSNSTTSSTTQTKTYRTLTDLRADNDIWYKILVLIHDLRTMAKDKTSANRLSQTTDALYLSAPYFTDSEAGAIKAALVEDGKSMEEVLTGKLENFFEKRRASGDWRPCGPHDLAPVFMEGFGVEKGEVEDERFLGRVRRAGVGGK